MPRVSATIDNFMGAADADEARTAIEAVATDGTGAEAAAFRGAIDAASSALQIPAESLASATLVHDDCTGDNQTLAAAATRNVEPGPGIMTAGAVPSTSLVRYEGGALSLTPMPSGSGQVVAHWGARTVAPGLTMIAEITPAWRAGMGAGTRVGFSDVTNSPRHRAGMLNLTGEFSVVGSSPSNSLPKITVSEGGGADSEFFAAYGTFNPGEKVRVRITYDADSKPEFFIQGGRYADFGCELGTDDWFLLGKSPTAVSGTVYPMVANQSNGSALVHDVLVMSSYTPSPRHQAFDHVRANNNVHIPSFGLDPVTGLAVLAWNLGEGTTGHTGPGEAAIRYSVKLADGTWTAAADLIPAPVSPAGMSVCSLSQVSGVLYLVYWKTTDGADGGTLYWRTVSINPTTGVATLGTETLMGVSGTMNLSFSPIITLPSGRLILPYHKGTGSPLLAYVSVSDDNGATWTETVIADPPPAGMGWAVEPTLHIETDGAVGAYMRTSGTERVAYYSRCADPDASPPVWSTPVPVPSIPQPGASGGRMQVITMPDGTGLLIGNDHKTTRRNVTIWKVGDNAAILGKTRVGDLEFFGQVATGVGVMQYPTILIDGDDLLIAYSHQPNAGASLSCQIRLHTWRWTEPVAKEAGGTGLRAFPRPASTNRAPVPYGTIAYSTTPTPDMSLANLFDLRLTASTATVGAPLHPMPWETLTLVVTQAAPLNPLGHTLAFNAVFEMNGTTPTLRTAVGASNVFVFRYNGFTNKWVLQSFN